MRGWPVILIGALAVACESASTTAIVVEVTSDLPAETPIELRVSGADQRLIHQQILQAGRLPGRLELVPADPAQPAPITAEATAFPGMPFAFSRTATASFRPGAILLLRLPVKADCACARCPIGQTCEDGACASSSKDSLPVYSPGALARPMPSHLATLSCPTDAGTDAGPMNDAGADSGGGTPDLASDRGVAPEVVVDGPAVSPDAGADVATPAPDAAAPDAAPDTPASPDLMPLLDAARPPDLTPDLAPDVAPDVALPPDAPAPLPQGAACSGGDQCASRSCVRGICCSSACNTPCTGCSQLETNQPDGTCAPVVAGTDPRNDCIADTPASCGYDGLCSGTGACRLYGPATICAPPTCNVTVHSPARLCTGAGGCGAPVPNDCGLFLCSVDGCLSGCALPSHAGCATSAYCNGSTCLPRKPLGQACTENRQCASNLCLLLLCS